MNQGPLIAVCGTSQASPQEAAVARRCGELLASRKAIVVCGGLGGVMTAVAQGVASAHGIAIGLLPGDDPAQAAPELTLALPTGLGELRNGLIARMCRGMIAIGGGYGTLSEIAFMLRIGRPVAAVQTWDFSAPDSESLSPREHRCASGDEAVEWILEEVSGHGG